MRSKVMFVGALALVVASTAACTKQQMGTVVGGSVGGYLGSQIGSGDGQLAATAIGALAGGLIGQSVGASMDEVDRMNANQALETARVGQTTTWQNPDTGTTYAVTPTHTYQTASGPCREYTTESIIGGQRETVYGTACRQPDGSWQASN